MSYYCQQCWNFYHACDCIGDIDIDGLPIARAPNDDDNDNDTGGNPNPAGNTNPNPNPAGNTNPNPNDGVGNPNDGVGNPNPNSLGVVNPNSDWIPLVTVHVDSDGRPTAGLEQHDAIDIKWDRNIPSNKRQRPTKSMVVTVVNTDGSGSVDYVVPAISYYDVYENGDKRNWLFHMNTPDSVDIGIPRAAQYPEKYQDINMKTFMKWYVKSTDGVNNCDLFWDMIENQPDPIDYNSGVRYYADCKSYSGTGWSDYSGKVHFGYPKESDWPNVDPNGRGPVEPGQVYVGTYPRMWDMNFKRFSDEFIEENSLDGKSFIDEWPNNMGPAPEGWRSFYNYRPSSDRRGGLATKHPYIFPDAYDDEDDYNEGYELSGSGAVIVSYVMTTVPVVRPFSFYARRNLTMSNLSTNPLINWSSNLYSGNVGEDGDRDNYIIGFPYEHDGLPSTFKLSLNMFSQMGTAGCGFQIFDLPSTEVVVNCHSDPISTQYDLEFSIPGNYVSYYGMVRMLVKPKSVTTTSFRVLKCTTKMTRGFSYKRILMSDLGATNDMVGNSYNGPSYKAFNNFEQVVDGLGKPAAWICHGHYKSTKDVSGQNFTYDMRTNTRLHLTSHVGYAANETKSTFGPSNSGGIGYLIAMVIRTID